MEHLAVMDLETINKILIGSKLIESRFSKKKISPYNKVNIGDIVYLKQSGKSIIARFEVSKVEYFDNLNIDIINKIKDEYNYLINASDEYWNIKLDSNYGTLICIKNPQTINPIKFDKKDRRGFVSINNKIYKNIGNI